MSEKELIVNNLVLEYKGLFHFQDLYSEIGRLLGEMGYKKHQKDYEETVTSSGKDIYIEFRPVKPKTAYMSLMIKIRINLNNVREVTHEVDGVPVSFNEGEISMTFDGWVSMDYQARWGKKPFFYFVRSVINHWVYKFPLEGGFSGEVSGDVHKLYQQLKAHLNLYRYKTQPQVAEQ